MILILRSHSGKQEPLENVIFHFGLNFLLLLLVVVLVIIIITLYSWYYCDYYHYFITLNFS